jgi:hypothetical protein
VDRFPADVETDLPDLQEMPLDELRAYDRDALAPCLDRVRQQADRPRHNIGSSGPPGRTD